MKIGLLIGRFQPLHRGHVHIMEKALEEVDELLIGIGSSQYHHLPENPFSYEERKRMIDVSLKGNYRTFPIPDILEDEKWVEHVEKLAGKFDVVYGGNSFVNSLFQEKGYPVREVPRVGGVSSTKLRGMMMRRDLEWKRIVPEPVLEYVEAIDGAERVRKLLKHEPHSMLSTDVIVEYKGGIVFVERQTGETALPGGFVEFGEPVKHAAVREVEEETGLRVKIKGILDEYSDPNRDTRTHVVSIAFVARYLDGELKGGDDAKSAFVLPIEKARARKLAFDHNQMLEDYYRRFFHAGVG